MANKPDDPNAPKPGDKGHNPDKDDADLFDTVPPQNVEDSGIPAHEWAAIEDTHPPQASPPEPTHAPPDQHEAWPVTETSIELPPEPVVELPTTVPAPDSSTKFGAPVPPVPNDLDDGGALAELIADSGVNLTDQHPLYRKSPVPDDSGLDLGGSVDVVPGAALSSGHLAALDDSNVDLGNKPEIASAVSSGSSIDLAEDAVVGQASAAFDAGDSAVDLAADVPAQQVTPTSDSAIAVDADAIVDESAIDLPGDVIVEEVSETVAPRFVAAPPTQAAIDLEAEEADDSGIDLAGPPVGGVSPSGSGSAIDLPADVIIESTGESGIDLSGASAGVSGPSADSSIDLGSEEVIAEEGIDLPGGEEVVDLTQEDVLAMTGPGESGIDLADVVPTGDSGSLRQRPGESGIDLIAEDVILEEPAVSAASGGSGRDLIAEGLESGLDLMGKPAKKTQAKDSDDALDEFLDGVTGDESSSVDLGSVHTMNVLEESLPGGSSMVPPPDSGAVAEVDLADEELAEDVPLEEITVSEEGEEVSRPVLGGGTDQITVSEEVSAVGEGLDLEMMAPEVAEEEEVSQGSVEMEVSEGDLVETNINAAALPADVELEEEDEEEARPAAKKKGKKAVDDDDDEEVAGAAKAKPIAVAPKPRGRFGAFVGGGMLAGFLTLAAAAAVLVFGLDVILPYLNELQDAVGVKPTKLASDGPKADDKDKQRPSDQPGGVEVAMNRIASGDFDKVKEEDLKQAKEDDAEHMLARANFRWKKYLAEQRGKKLDAKAEPVVQALEDLGKVSDRSAEARLRRGQILQRVGKADEAKAEFEAGKKQHATDERFEAALDALELSESLSKWLPREVPPQLLVVLLMMLQDQQPPPQQATPEAGVPFLKALKAVKSDRYSEALALLAEARKRHNDRRFERPNKPQNPTSDPEEAIFLFACDQLKDYWSLLGGLKDPKKPLAKDHKHRKLVDDYVATTQGPLTKMVDDQKNAITKLEKSLKTVEDELKDAKVAHEVALKKAEKDLEGANKTLKETQTNLTASIKREDDLKAMNKVALDALNKVADAVGSKFDGIKDADTLVKDATETAATAKSNDPEGTIKKLRAQVAADQSKLKDRWEPAQLLPVWLAVLQSDRARTDLHADASKDVQRVLADKSASDGNRARARALEGLIQRNEDKYAQAKKTLEQAKDELGEARVADWVPVVDEALKEVSNPAAVIARRADELASRNRTADALSLLKKGLASLEGKKGELHALRARITLEGAISRGKLTKDDPDLADARKDAKAAADEKLAEGHFVLGRIDEELGNLKEAVASYRAAVKMHDKLDEQGSRYSAALARALSKSLPRVGGPRPQPPRDRISKLMLKPKESELSSSELFVLLALMLQPVAKDLPAQDVIEAEKLADEIIALGNKAPFDALAQALVVKRLYTRALEAYLQGLRDNGLLAPQHSNALLEIVRNHPGMKPPRSLDAPAPDPTAAEKAYASGLNFYARKKYAEAEREFAAAVEFDNGDARYYYYLGLSRLAQGNRDGYEDFDTAARLERLGRPDRAAVSQSLERVQGPLRKALNEVRDRPVKDRAK